MRVGRVDQSFEYVDVKLNQQQVQPMDGALRKLQREVEQQVQDAQEKRDVKLEDIKNYHQKPKGARQHGIFKKPLPFHKDLP